MSHTARDFLNLVVELSPELGDLAEMHKVNYPLFATVAEQIDAELLQAERQIGINDKNIELLHERMVDCSQELVLAWKQCVYDAKIP